MQLQLVRSVATKLDLRDALEEEIEREGFDLRHRNVFEADSSAKFSIEFEISLTISKKKALTVEYVSYFETSSEFEEEFKTSHFVEKNAPAIAFPFIRSYIAHITLIAGYKSVILPSVNFTVANDGSVRRLKA